MLDQEKWKCPWCNQTATQRRTGICDSRLCECGALGVGAPSVDYDEVTDEAIGYFGVEIRPESRGFEDRLRQDVFNGGIEVRDGVRDPEMGHPLGVEYVYTWFKKAPQEGA